MRVPPYVGASPANGSRGTVNPQGGTTTGVSADRAHVTFSTPWAVIRRKPLRGFRPTLSPRLQMAQEAQCTRRAEPPPVFPPIARMGRCRRLGSSFGGNRWAGSALRWGPACEWIKRRSEPVERNHRRCFRRSRAWGVLDAMDRRSAETAMRVPPYVGASPANGSRGTVSP
jgi:hypothetical protein